MKTTQATGLHQRAQLAQLLEHADWLHGLAVHLVRDGNEAEDVLQEALLAASGSSRPEGVPRRLWLGGILKNVVRGRHRQGRVRSERERIVAAESHRAAGDGAVSSAAADVVQLESQRLLLGHVESLPEAQRGAVVARFYEGLPPRKIAQREGIPVSTVNSRIQRGIETLRQRLDAEHGDRRTWAALILPLARVSQAPKLPMALGALAAAAAALVLVSAAWLLLDPRGSAAGTGDPALPQGPADAKTARRPDGPRPPAGMVSTRQVAGIVAPRPRTAEKLLPKGPRLHVRVVDRNGERVESGLTIGANARVDMPSIEGRMGEDLDERVSDPLKNGLASFGNPWEHMTIYGMEKGPDTWHLFEVHRVYIEGPGLAEFEPEASRDIGFFPLKPGDATDMECTLTLPPRGSVRLEIFDTDGERIGAGGTANLVFPGVAHHDLGQERVYGVPIVDGVAEWSDFVTGSRPFEVRVHLPSLGSSWSTAGIGPRRSGDVATATTQRPQRPAITARVVDEAGEPLELDWLT